MPKGNHVSAPSKGLGGGKSDHMLLHVLRALQMTAVRANSCHFDLTRLDK